MLLAAVGGCVSSDYGPAPQIGDAFNGCGCGCGPGKVPSVPGVQGPWGQPVPMAAPYSSNPPSEGQARAMMSASLPLSMVNMAGLPGSPNSGIIQTSAQMPADDPGVARINNSLGVSPAGGCPPGGCPPGGCPPGGCMPNPMLPPGVLAPPGVPFAPGMPAPGNQPVPGGPAGVVAAVGALTAPPPGVPVSRTEVRFVGPAGMKITWFAPGPDGRPGFGNTEQLEAPARYNFAQAAIYRLKISNLPNRPGAVLYPTLEVVPANSKTSTFLAHSAVPVNITEEDLEQVAAGNYVVKVIYLPDPQYQDFAATGPDEVVSSRLEPGMDPIKEACKRGCILLVVRIGNIDLEAPNTPAMDAPSPYQLKPHAQAPLPPQMMPPGMAAGQPGMMMPPPGMAGGQPGMMMPPPGMFGPNGPMGPGMGLPPGLLPPGAGQAPPRVPGVPTGSGASPTLPPPPNGPVGMLPDRSKVEQMQFKAAAAASDQPAAPTADKAKPADKPADKGLFKRWW